MVPSKVLAKLQSRGLDSLEEDEEFITILQDIPRQFPSKEDKDTLESYAEAIVSILATAFVLSLILAFFLRNVM